MGWLDLAFLLIVGLAVLIAAWRGFVREAIALAAWFVAFWAAMSFGGAVEQALAGSIDDPRIRSLVAVVGVFFVALVVVGLLGMALSRLVRLAGLAGPDHFLGAMFGLLKGGFIVLVVVLVAGLTPLPQQPLWRESLLAGPLSDIVLSLRHWLPEVLAERLRYGPDDAGAAPVTRPDAGARNKA